MDKQLGIFADFFWLRQILKHVFFFVLMDGLSLVFIFCLLFFCGWVLSPNILRADGAMRSFFAVYNVLFS